MKKLLFTLLISISAFAAANAQVKVDFDKVLHNFGTVKVVCGDNGKIKSLASGETATLTCVYTFTNKGDSPVAITNAMTTCGCTKPSYAKMPVAPGEKAEISVTYNAAGNSLGHFKKSFSVQFNDDEIRRLYIEGDLEAGTE